MTSSSTCDDREEFVVGCSSFNNEHRLFFFFHKYRHTSRRYIYQYLSFVWMYDIIFIVDHKRWYLKAPIISICPLNIKVHVLFPLQKKSEHMCYLYSKKTKLHFNNGRFQFVHYMLEAFTILTILLIWNV
jgi:hypothetical protein